MPIGDRFPQVLAAARAGADWAWAELYEAYAPHLLRFIAGQGAHEPEDCLGECFVQLVRNLPRFSGDEPAFRAWLFLLARNRVVDEWRAARRRPAAPSGDAVTARTVAEPADAGIAARGAVADLLTTLAPDQRAVVVLRVLEGFSVAETARILRRSAGAIRVLQHRALKKLRTALEAAPPPEASPQAAAGRRPPGMVSVGLAE